MDIEKVKHASVIAAAVTITALAGYVAYDHLYQRPVGGASVIAKESPVTKGQPTVLVPLQAPLKTKGGKSKALAKLPDAVIADDNKVVAGAAQVASDLHPHSITTVVDKATGDVTMYDKVDPYPWLAVEQRGEIGLAYGYKYSTVTHGAQPTGRLMANYDVLRVKALTLGVTGTLDTDRATFVGVAIKYKF